MNVNFQGEAAPMTAADYERAARDLGCEVAAIRAVAEVESSGGGFLQDGRPKILFESRWFHKLTGGQWDAEYPRISTPTWIRNYLGGAAEYGRLLQAMRLNEEAALKSASWGMFQILGVNHAQCGYAHVQQFVEDMVASEGAQLDAFCGFILSNRLVDELRDRRWADFARVYNGPGYAANRYDEKMLVAYQNATGGAHRASTTEVQQALNRVHGAGLTPDGHTGPRTTAAVQTYQEANDLEPTGWADDATLAALGLV